jgi:hypothetical protein
MLFSILENPAFTLVPASRRFYPFKRNTFLNENSRKILSAPAKKSLALHS